MLPFLFLYFSLNFCLKPNFEASVCVCNIYVFTGNCTVYLRINLMLIFDHIIFNGNFSGVVKYICFSRRGSWDLYKVKTL